MCKETNKKLDVILEECIKITKENHIGIDTTEILMAATNIELKLKYNLEKIKLLKKNITEEEKTKIKTFLKSFDEFIKAIKNRAKAYILFKRSLETITAEPIAKAILNMKELDSCVKAENYTDDVIDICYKKSFNKKTKKYSDREVYHCICGWNPLQNLSFFEHYNVDKPFIIGCVCITNLEIYLKFEQNEDVAEGFRNLIRSYEKNKHKLDKKNCRGCKQLTLTKSKKTKDYKNLYCEGCINENDDGSVEVKCMDCNSMFAFENWKPRCEDCWKVSKNKNKEIIIYNF